MNEERTSLPRPRCRRLHGIPVLGTGSFVPDRVVGGDGHSQILNRTDIKTHPVFGDGGGAVLVGRGSPERGLLAYSLGADGSGGDLLRRPAGGSRMKLTPETLSKGLHYMHMDG